MKARNRPKKDRAYYCPTRTVFAYRIRTGSEGDSENLAIYFELL